MKNKYHLTEKMTGQLFTVLIIITMLLVLLTGCRNEDVGFSFDAQSYDADSMIDCQLLNIVESEYAYYIDESFFLPDDIGQIRHVVYYDNSIYFTVEKYEHNDENDNIKDYFSTTIYSIDIGGANLTMLTSLLHKNDGLEVSDEYTHITGLCVDSGGNLWFIEAGSGRYVRKLDSRGTELLSIDISGVLGVTDNSIVRDIAIDNLGNIYLVISSWSPDRQDIYVLDNTGDLLFREQVTDKYIYFIKMPDGSVVYTDELFFFEGIWYQRLQTFDVAEETLGDVINIQIPGERSFTVDEYTGLQFYSGVNVYNQGSNSYGILLNDSMNLYGYTLDNKSEAVKLINWLEIGITTPNSIRDMQIISENEIICIKSVTDPLTDTRSPSFEIHILGMVPRSELPELIELTLATTYVDNMSIIPELVADFNAKNPSYRINLQEYAPELKFTSDDSVYNTALERLNIDIITGNTPDIFLTYHIPYAEYAQAGVFADLYQFIDADDKLSRDDFVPTVLRMAEINGGLYRIPTMFLVFSITGDSAILGSETGWDLNEFESVLNTHLDADIPMGYYNNIDFLHEMILLENDKYINFEAGTVDFDTPHFTQLLKISGKLPDKLDTQVPIYEAISEGRQIMTISSLNFFYNNSIPFLNPYNDIVIKGFPLTDTRRHIIRDFQTGFAISDKSQYKDVAWEFIKNSLSEEWQMKNPEGFPTVQFVLNKYAQNMIGEHNLYGVQFTVTQEDVDMVMTVINSAYAIPDEITGSSLISDMLNIISENATDYYSGSINAEDAARIIQSRVSILVSEQS